MHHRPHRSLGAPSQGIRRRVRPDHQAGRRPAHRHLRLLGRRSAQAADRPRL